MRLLALVILLCSSSCVARRGVVSVIYANGQVVAGEEFYEPEVKGGAVVFKKDGSVTITPLINIFEAYWFEGLTLEELRELQEQEEGSETWRLGSSKR